MRTSLPIALVTAAALALAPVVTYAQDSPVADVQTGPEVSESHLAAAAEVLDAMNMQETLDKSIDATLAAQMAQMPQMAAVEDIMREFFREHMSYEALRDDYVRLYAETYSEKDLRALKKFYGTPLGKKVVASTPDLTAAGMEIGQRATAEHMPELQQKIMAKMAGGGN